MRFRGQAARPGVGGKWLRELYWLVLPDPATREHATALRVKDCTGRQRLFFMGRGLGLWLGRGRGLGRWLRGWRGLFLLGHRVVLPLDVRGDSPHHGGDHDPLWVGQALEQFVGELAPGNLLAVEKAVDRVDRLRESGGSLVREHA